MVWKRSQFSVLLSAVLITAVCPVNLRDKIDKGFDNIIVVRVFPRKGKLIVHKGIINQVLPDVGEGYFIKLILIGDDNSIFF